MKRPSHRRASGGWLVLVYRVAPEPSSSRVAVWRDLKRIGAHYLQQCVCVVPHRPDLRAAVDGVREKIARLGGSSNLFETPSLPVDEEDALIAGFKELVAKQYAEIVEECDTKFVKEIEFETFRENYTFAEAEEIEQDLEKIRRWYARVRERDWFDAPGRDEAEVRIARCAELLEGFYFEVHARAAGHASGPDAREMEQDAVLLVEIPPPSGRKPSRRRQKGDTA
ncbi:MAG TPA: Chromate resistance protein ChrB [Chloroflexota bacterium]|nr:Chromate resistance protein ChrB [Chloroflexota bacterium]